MIGYTIVQIILKGASKRIPQLKDIKDVHIFTPVYDGTYVTTVSAIGDPTGLEYSILNFTDIFSIDSSTGE